jgi:hypothetical protein
VIRRAVAIGLVSLFAFVAASPLLACGWEATASARHACCSLLEDGCTHDGGQADACCAQGESTRNPNHEPLVKGHASLALALSGGSIVAVVDLANRDEIPHRLGRASYAASTAYLRHAILRI